MKKITASLISLFLLLSLVACSNESIPSGSSMPSSNSISGETTGSEIPTENETLEKEEISFEEITVVDNEQCLIKITGIEPDNIWGYTLKTYLENKSTDKTYMFAVDAAAVNGIQVEPAFATEVAAGKKSNEKINFSDSNLSTYGIKDFTDIELCFRVYDTNDWSADSVAEETVHIYPLGEDKATAFVREPQASDTVIVDNDNATVIVTGYIEDDIWGYTVNLYLVNKTDKDLMFAADEASVNGFMADPFWATSVNAGKVEFSSMSWSNSDLEANDIKTVEEIEMTIRIYNSNDWSEDDIFNDTITLTP